MESNPFKLVANSEQKVYNYFGRTKEQVDEDIQIVKKWMETQTYLPEIMEEAKIRNILIITKFNIEKAKEKVSAYYSLRRLMPDWFRDNSPHGARMLAANKQCIWAVLPKQLDGLYRVHFFKLRSPGSLKPYEAAIQFFNIVEMRLKDDYLTGDIIFVDGGNASFKDYLKPSPLFFIKSFKVYQKMFPIRLKAMHFMNTTPTISLILKIAKTIIKPKIFQRITASRDDFYLRELLSEDEIPSDYGGNAPSIQELNNLLVQKFSEHQDLFEKLESFVE